MWRAWKRRSRTGRRARPSSSRPATSSSTPRSPRSKAWRARPRARPRGGAHPAPPFRLVERDGGLAILKGGEPFIEGVDYLPNLMHAPGMAFVNIESGCAMDCKFCATPHLKRDQRKRVKKEEWLKRLLEVAKREDLKSIGITAGGSGGAGTTRSG